MYVCIYLRSIYPSPLRRWLTLVIDKSDLLRRRQWELLLGRRRCWYSDAEDTSTRSGGTHLARESPSDSLSKIMLLKKKFNHD